LEGRPIDERTYRSSWADITHCVAFSHMICGRRLEQRDVKLGLRALVVLLGPGLAGN
jgi:hypothetical protein